MRDRRAVVDVEQTLHGDRTTQLEIVSPGDEQGGPITVDAVRSVRSTRGPVHCGWQDMRFVDVDVSAFPPEDRQGWRTYVANPTASSGQDGWDPDTDLPADAVDTGWRRGTTQLGLAADDGAEAAFLVDGPTVERLPLDETGQGCD